MTAAQKTAKANFKKAIEYRKKTGVSLKEAFAHVYGRKVGAASKKKATKKAAPKKAVKKVVKKAAPKKVAKKAAPKKHTKYGKVKAHTRRVAGTKIINQLKISDLKKGLEIISNEHPEWGSFIVDRKYDKGIWEITGKSGTRTLFEDEVRFWRKLPPKFTFLSGVRKNKKVSEKAVLTKIHKVKDQVNQLDELQHKHMIGKISQHNLDKIKSSLQELKQLERHLAILKNAKPKIVKYQLPVIRKEIKNTVNSIKEVKTHIAQLKKSI